MEIERVKARSGLFPLPVHLMTLKSANLIVIADVNAGHELGATEPVQFGTQLLRARAYTADLSIRRTLKGAPVPEEITVPYPLPVTFVGPISPCGPLSQ